MTRSQIEDVLRSQMRRLPPALPFDMIVMDAQQQQRTPCDVPAGKERVRPRVPSKDEGRKGTRRAWKRRHPPRWRNLFAYREPENIIVCAGSARVPFPNGFERDLWIVTPAQRAMVLKLGEKRNGG